MTDYLKKYGVQGTRKFQEGGAAAPAPAPAGPEGGAGAGAELSGILRQVADGVDQGDEAAMQAAQVMIAALQQAMEGGGGAPAAANGSKVYRNGGSVASGPTFNRKTLVPKK